jgi:hypothetical protein
MKAAGYPPFLTSILLVLALLHPAGAMAENGEGSVFCAWAQQVIASTSLVADVVTQTDFDGFVASKASADPLTVQQYWSNPADGADGIARVVSCKMKTAERINYSYSVKSPGDIPAAAGDQSCDTVHRAVLAELLNNIPRAELVVSADTLRVDPEEQTFIGPMWLKPWPFQPLSRDEDGLIHLHSRALYVPFSWWIPMPDKFKGNYYCHLVAPDFLEAVLRGDLPAGV